MRLRTLIILTIAITVISFASGCSSEEQAKQETTCTASSSAVKAKTCPKVQEAEKGSKLVVIANQESYDLSKDVIKFIETRGVPVMNVGADKADKFKTAKYIVLLAGPTASDATGELTKEILTAEEAAWAGQMGNKKMYLKTNQWADEQYVLVFAGFDANATFRALVNSKDRWWAYISSWFNIELTHEEVYGY